MAKLHDIDVDDFLAECVKIDPLALSEEYIRLPADIAYWNARRSQALREQLHAGMERKRVQAGQRITLRERLALEHGKVTESMVDSAVEESPEYREAAMRELEAEVEHERLRGVVEALRAKKDMVVSLGATMRAEFEGDPLLKRWHRDARTAQHEE